MLLYLLQSPHTYLQSLISSVLKKQQQKNAYLEQREKDVRPEREKEDEFSGRVCQNPLPKCSLSFPYAFVV